MHFIKGTTSLWLWVSLVILASLNHFLAVSGLVFAGYFSIKGLMHWIVGRKLGDGYPVYLIPVLDLIHVVFVPVSTLVSTLSKKVKWK